MRILGIDPGIARVGWGMIEENKSEIRVISFDCFETKKTEEEGQRLAQVYKFLQALVKREIPDAIAVEELYFTTNVKTAMRVAQARGVILLVAAQAKIPVVSYNPLSVKLAVTGFGGADKRQVMMMIQKILKMPQGPKLDDTADALAVAVSHAYSYKLKVK